jgi:hypothetical protein
MTDQADVKSIDTLAFVRTAFASFAHEANQALGEIEIQGQRAVEYICMDRAAYWKSEIRRSNDLVNKAIKDLEHCRTFKKVGDNTPSCIEEKKALEKARKRLAFAEEKAELVRKWTPVVQQQFRETGVRVVRFRDVIDVDCPRAMAQLERMLRALDQYQNTSSPTAGNEAEASGGAPSVKRQLDEADTSVSGVASSESTPTEAS